MARAAWMVACALLLAAGFATTAKADSRPRLFVLTDIGNEPDDAQSMVRLLLYANEFRIEGLVATTSKFLPSTVNPQQIRARIDAYGRVYNNLTAHAPNFPSAQQLSSKVAQGHPALGMKGVGGGKDSSGSELLIRAVDASSEPLWVSIWGGPNTLAQALWKVRNTRSSTQLAAFVDKLRVYAIEDQDDSGAWIRSNFPDLFYIYGWAWQGISSKGGDSSLVDNAWIDRHVQNHGALGALYPDTRYIMEGDTPSWLYLVPNGLGVPEQPSYGSWGGRYAFSNGAYRDTNDNFQGQSNIWATVYRWRPAYQNDFQARMDWSVGSNYSAANHPPVAAVLGSLRRTVSPGAVVQLDASPSTAPTADSGQRLSYEWAVYDEPSSYDGPLTIQGATSVRASFVAPNVSAPRTVHVILTVRDNGSPALSRYQRVIVTVDPGGSASAPPPAPSEPGFVTGVNFGGGDVKVEGNSLRSFAAARSSGLTVSSGYLEATTSLTPVPATDASTASMLNSAIWSSGQQLTLRQPLANGRYAIYLWVMENYATNFRSFDLAIEGGTAANAIGTNSKGGWRKYGPYTANVGDGALDVSLVRRSGDPHVMGMAVFRSD